MAFSEATITHTFKNADGTPASGSIEFTLTKRMTQPNESIEAGSVTANLDGTGKLSQKLTANNDEGTSPTDAQWRVQMRILGGQDQEWFITVPKGGGSVDLGTLLPQQPRGG